MANIIRFIDIITMKAAGHTIEEIGLKWDLLPETVTKMLSGQIDSHQSIVLKQIRKNLGLDRYPMAVYLGVNHQQYLDWEEDRAIVPPDMFEYIESLKEVPNISAKRNPDQYEQRHIDMLNRRAKDQTYEQIAKAWGLTPPRVWQLLHKSNDP